MVLILCFWLATHLSPRALTSFASLRQIEDLRIDDVNQYVLDASLLTGDARPRFFESYALLEEQVRRARSDDGRL